ncbi:hypothetical protein V6Z11_A03G092200 [Gossypium hirsutum]
MKLLTITIVLVPAFHYSIFNMTYCTKKQINRFKSPFHLYHLSSQPSSSSLLVQHHFFLFRSGFESIHPLFAQSLH